MTDQTASLPSQQANMRHASDFKRAARHSFKVSVLKKTFPLLAVLLCLYFAASSYLSFTPLGNLQLENASLKDGKLVMQSPKMAGVNKQNNPYTVKAKTATQDLRTPDIIVLDAIDAQLPMDTKTSADLTATSGVYNTKTEKMILNDEVVIKGARGMDIFLKDADIDMKTGTMTSSNPVKILSKDADITADSIRVEDNGKRIVFKQRVRMIITRPLTRGKPTADTAATNTPATATNDSTSNPPALTNSSQ